MRIPGSSAFQTRNPLGTLPNFPHPALATTADAAAVWQPVARSSCPACRLPLDFTGKPLVAHITPAVVVIETVVSLSLLEMRSPPKDSWNAAYIIFFLQVSFGSGTGEDETSAVACHQRKRCGLIHRGSFWETQCPVVGNTRLVASAFYNPQSIMFVQRTATYNIRVPDCNTEETSLPTTIGG